MLRRLIPLLIFFGFLHFGLEAKACSCSERPSVYKEFHDASAVFVGKAIGSRGAPVTEIIGDQPRQFTETIFQFSVSEAFKGVKGSQIEISVGVVRISCYHTFNVGDTYLVYAFGNGEQILSSVYCSRTRNLEDAASDLHYIRELLRGVPEPRVYGSITRIETVVEGDKAVRRAIPVAGVKVSIEGEVERFEVVTDQRGLYRLEQIPDGKYKARPLLPKEYKFRLWSFEEFTLSKDPHIFGVKAATSDFYVEWKNELSGEILDSEGNRIERAKVNVLFHRNRAPVRIGGHEFHHAGFGFSGLIPGMYLLSVTINAPFQDKTKPTDFYYPGTLNLDQAERIEVGIDQTIKKDFRLPPGYVVRKITGVLEWPNGEPVSRGRVTLNGSKDSVGDGDNYDASLTDELGRFSLQGFVGGEYWIYGQSKSQGERIKIKVEKTNEPLKIVLPLPKPKD